MRCALCAVNCELCAVLCTLPSPPFTPCLVVLDCWLRPGQVSKQFSARDLPGQLSLKQRDNSIVEKNKNRDFKAELAEKELKNEQKKLAAVANKGASAAVLEAIADRAMSKFEVPKLEDDTAVLAKATETYDDGDDDVGGEDPDESDSSSDDSDDDDDDEAELLAELDRIKKEREEERVVEQQAEQQAAEAENKMAVLEGNPLTRSGSGSGVMKRRWDDDVVFKNQARGAPETKKRFINDTIRNDFHRKFINKYIQ